MNTDDDANFFVTNLVEGANIITITVTAENTETQDYVITVTREAAADATLSSLTLSAGTLTPTFAADVHAYTASVGFDVATLAITAVNNDPAADLVAIVSDQDAAASFASVALAVGMNVLTVTVTAEGGTPDVGLCHHRHARRVGDGSAAADADGVDDSRWQRMRRRRRWRPRRPLPASSQTTAPRTGLPPACRRRPRK